MKTLDTKDQDDMPAWLGKLDISSLKLKVASSLVAISSIHLLQKFLNAEHISNDKLLWYAIIHMIFVVSAFAMGMMDKIAKTSL